MKRTQQGFTLIELMIVVAIIGILAALAIPNYINYTKRAKVSEALAMASPYKAAVAEYFSSDETLPEDLADAGLPTFTSTDYVSAITLANGTISATAYPQGVGTGTPVVLRLEPTTSQSGVDWTCYSDDFSISPKECRNTAP